VLPERTAARLATDSSCMPQAGQKRTRAGFERPHLGQADPSAAGRCADPAHADGVCGGAASRAMTGGAGGRATEAGPGVPEVHAAAGPGVPEDHG